MRKIAFITLNSMTRLGVTSVILNLLDNMDTTTHDFVLITAAKVDQWVIEKFKTQNIRYIPIEAKRKNLFSYRKELKSILSVEKPDVVHVHGNSATMYLEIAVAKKVGVPVRIAHSHTSSSIVKFIHCVLRPFLVKAMTHGIGCSDLSRTFAFKNSPKSFVLNNGIITTSFAFDNQIREAIRTAEKLDDTFVIGHVGNCVPVKNHEFIIKIAKELKKKALPNYKILFLGKGPLEDQINTQISENGLSETVMLMGSRSNVNQIYQAMDMFILPSLYEGFPMVLVEAQTSGLSCLISDKVSKATDLINKAKYLPIDSPNAVELWANEIEKAMNAPLLDRSGAKDIIDQKGYSAKSSAQTLMKIYTQES